MFKRLAVLVILVAAATANGQVGSGKVGYPTFLLRYASVQKDLGMGASAAKKVEGIQQATKKRYMAMISPSPSNPQAMRQPTAEDMGKLSKWTNDSFLALLNSGQKKRLKEIGVQYFGAYGLSSPEISSALKITAEQRVKLDKSRIESSRALQKLTNKLVQPGHVSPKASPHMKETMKAALAARATMMKKMVADAEKILTPQQVSVWKKLRGRPFPVETLFSQAGS